MIYMLGVIDDLRNLSPKIKFAGQLLVAIMMYMCDIRITFITNYFGPGNSDLGTVLCFIITILWIVGITNTVNLIDGLDGLAAGTAAIVSVYRLRGIHSRDISGGGSYAGSCGRGFRIPAV